MNGLPTGDEDDPRVLLGRLIERIDRTHDWMGEWMSFIHYRLEAGHREMSELRALIARVETRLEYHRAPPEKKPRGVMGSLIELMKAGKEFVEAVASLKELALAIAIIVAAGAVMYHPAALKDLIATYNASGREGHD